MDDDEGSIRVGNGSDYAPDLVRKTLIECCDSRPMSQHGSEYPDNEQLRNPIPYFST